MENQILHVKNYDWYTKEAGYCDTAASCDASKRAVLKIEKKDKLGRPVGGDICLEEGECPSGDPCKGIENCSFTCKIPPQTCPTPPTCEECSLSNSSDCLKCSGGEYVVAKDMAEYILSGGKTCAKECNNTTHAVAEMKTLRPDTHSDMSTQICFTDGVCPQKNECPGDPSSHCVFKCTNPPDPPTVQCEIQGCVFCDPNHPTTSCWECANGGLYINSPTWDNYVQNGGDACIDNCNHDYMESEFTLNNGTNIWVQVCLNQSTYINYPIIFPFLNYAYT